MYSRAKSILLIALTVLLAACGGATPTTRPPENAPPQPAAPAPAPAPAPAGAPAAPAGTGPVRIGLVTSMTGPLAATAKQLWTGAQLAVNEWNERGGVRGRKVELLVEDDQSSPNGAINATNKLLSQDLSLLFGPGFSALMLAVQSRINDARVPTFTGASAPPITDQKNNPGGWVFRLRVNDDQAGVVLAQYILDVSKPKRPAILFANNDYGKGGYQVVTDVLAKAGVKWVATEQFNQNDKDVSAQLSKIKAANPDLVVVYAIPLDAALVAVQAQQQGLDLGRVVGSGGFSTPDFLKLVGSTAGQIGYFFIDSVAGQDEATRAWADKVRAIAPEVSVSFSSSLAYDATNLALAAMDRSGKTDPASVRELLRNTRNYPGISGPLSFAANGDGLHQGIIAKWVNGKLVILKTVALEP